MNLCVHIGNLTRDPDIRVMQSGKKKATFSVAVNREYKSQNGGYDADYIQFTAYEKTAELCERYLAKGRTVAVQSHVRTGSYEKDGKRVYTTEFIVDKIKFLSGKNDRVSGTGQAVPNTDGESLGDGYGEFTPINDDDLPF